MNIPSALKNGLMALTLVSAVALSATSIARAADPSVLRLATTTSTQNSGLLDILIPSFEEASGLSVKTHPRGTGEALRMGRNGQVDVVLVHAPAAEAAFIEAG